MGGGRLALFTRRRKWRRCWLFLLSDVTLVVQVRSSVMCTPRNLVLLTLSTVELSMVNRVSSEVHHNLFCFTHIKGQVVSTTPFSQLCLLLSVVCFIVVADEKLICHGMKAASKHGSESEGQSPWKPQLSAQKPKAEGAEARP